MSERRIYTRGPITSASGMEFVYRWEGSPTDPNYEREMDAAIMRMIVDFAYPVDCARRFVSEVLAGNEVPDVVNEVVIDRNGQKETLTFDELEVLAAKYKQELG